MLPEQPFGEDITNPHSRTMPPELHGTWLTEWNDMTVITSDRILKHENVACCGRSVHRCGEHRPEFGIGGELTTGCRSYASR